MSQQPWTIESICTALGSPAMSQRFLAEINRAPAPQLLTVFAKWERIATDTATAVERAREYAALEAHGQDIPGTWIDGTPRLEAIAARNRHQGAA